MSIGIIIRQRREELNLTQDQVAARVDISKPYLSNIETGKTRNPPSDGILRALETVLGFPEGELVMLGHEAKTPRDVREKHELMVAEVNRLHAILNEMLARGRGARNGQAPLDLDALARDIGSQSNVKSLSTSKSVPIINKVAAGYPKHFTDMDYPPSIADDYVRCPDVHDAQAFAAHVAGDSMEPLFHEGDIVVFSPNAPVRNGDDCFIRFEDGGTTFKRFYQDAADAIRLQPLNSRYAAEVHRPEKVTGVWPAVLRIERLRRTAGR